MGVEINLKLWGLPDLSVSHSQRDSEKGGFFHSEQQLASQKTLHVSQLANPKQAIAERAVYSFATLTIIYHPCNESGRVPIMSPAKRGNRHINHAGNYNSA